MNVSVETRSLSQIAADWIVVGVFQGAPLSNELEQLDRTLDGLISRLVDAKDITGKVMETVPLLGQTALAAPRVLVVGLGEPEAFGILTLLRASSAAAMQISTAPAARVAFALLGREQRAVEATQIAAAITRAATVASYGQDLYLAEKKRHPFGEIVLAAAADDDPDALRQAAQRGEVIGRAVNLARRLINEPAAKIYPESFADVARQVAEESLLDFDAFDEPRLRAERMEALLAVAAGSDRPPRMVVLEHRPRGDALKQAEANPVRLALVGKGVTFDSGGLSLKTATGMETMKCDMSGAAAVLGAMQAIAQLNLPVHVKGLMGLVENLPSGKAMKVGDVLTARNGVTIEVLNTDAEGRLVLADVLSYAVDQKATHIIDLATLTGACVVALGNDVTGLMSNDQPWADRMLAAAGAAGEAVWQLPLFDDYAEQIRGSVADIKNTGGRPGGAITAAKFLQRFVAHVPWVHLDIAGPAFAEKANRWRDGGGTGCMVPSLVALAAEIAKSAS